MDKCVSHLLLSKRIKERTYRSKNWEVLCTSRFNRHLRNTAGITLSHPRLRRKPSRYGDRAFSVYAPQVERTARFVANDQRVQHIHSFSKNLSILQVLLMIFIYLFYLFTN